ncbi:hypothetical protein BHE74_00003272 [Ensete ventricosum]|nr:hypothetical protein BHE74_00003272 [Ensete ventricosum]
MTAMPPPFSIYHESTLLISLLSVGYYRCRQPPPTPPPHGLPPLPTAVLAAVFPVSLTQATVTAASSSSSLLPLQSP